MKGIGSSSTIRRCVLLAGLVASACLPAQAQISAPHSPLQSDRASPQQTTNDQSASSPQEAESELQTGIALTRRGLFEEAIPHLRAVQGRVSSEYAANFDLALCYAGIGRYPQAIEILKGLSQRDPNQPEVQNLLAQAYVGNSQPQQALSAFEKAAALVPEKESLYVLVSDACMDHQNYDLGLKVVDLGLRHLPRSSRLHYQRAIVLSSLDEFDSAKIDYDLAVTLAPDSDTAYMAAAQKAVLAGDMPEAIRVVRVARQTGHENYVLLTILAQSLIHSGASPGQPEFAEAQSALEKAVIERPNYSVLQLATGDLYLLAGRLDDALAHLERARQLDPNNPSVYAHLATAYRRQGKIFQAQRMLSTLAELNRVEAEKISSAPGDRKASYAGPARAVTNQGSAPLE